MLATLRGVTGVTMASGGVAEKLGGSTECLRENSLLYLLLMLGTVWLGLSLYNFTKTYKSLFFLCTLYAGDVESMYSYVQRGLRC